MRVIEPGICALFLAAGGGRAAWLVSGELAEDMTAAGFETAVVASFPAYMFTDRKDVALWPGIELFGGAMAVSAASV